MTFPNAFIDHYSHSCAYLEIEIQSVYCTLRAFDAIFVLGLEEDAISSLLGDHIQTFRCLCMSGLHNVSLKLSKIKKNKLFFRPIYYNLMHSIEASCLSSSPAQASR